MTITTKGRYALRILLDLAQQDPEAIVPLNAIAKRQEISNKYLEMIMGMLHKAGIVKLASPEQHRGQRMRKTGKC